MYNKKITKNNQIYSQVYSILNLMGDHYKNKIPNKLLSFIDKSRDKSYMPVYNFDIGFKDQNVDKMALSIICILDLKYWCNDEERKDLIKKLKNAE